MVSRLDFQSSLHPAPAPPLCLPLIVVFFVLYETLLVLITKGPLTPPVRLCFLDLCCHDFSRYYCSKPRQVSAETEHKMVLQFVRKVFAFLSSVWALADIILDSLTVYRYQRMCQVLSRKYSTAFGTLTEDTIPILW